MNWKKEDSEYFNMWSCEVTPWLHLCVEFFEGKYLWDVMGNEGEAKTLPKAKKAAEDKLVEMFRELGAALGYEVD